MPIICGTVGLANQAWFRRCNRIVVLTLTLYILVYLHTSSSYLECVCAFHILYVCVYSHTRRHACISSAGQSRANFQTRMILNDPWDQPPQDMICTRSHACMSGWSARLALDPNWSPLELYLLLLDKSKIIRSLP